jgi:T4 RnlA family RNA ligase
MLDILEKYHNDGLLLKQTHPALPLTIWNYSPKVQYESLWDDITIQCRGLVTDFEGNIVARPFKKFFNYEELKPEDIPNETFDVFEKLDGSLGILFNYKGEWVLATRGSFTSDQAKKGWEILQKYDYKRLIEDKTYLFEIIYKENRIVVDYDYEDLIILGVIDNNDGYEYKIFDERIHLEGIRFVNMYRNLGFKFVKKYDGIKDYSTLKEIIKDDEEGFVIRFQSGFRMKIKGEEYKRLHRILTNISNRNIWEYLKDGKPLDELIDKVPDEFYDWVKETKENFENEFQKIKEEYESLYNSILNSNEIFSRKDFAIKAINSNFPSILFSMYDNRPYDQIIWKILYPDYSKPFKKNNDV